MTNKNLFLIVTKYWYDRIASGEKRVEYRENTKYWKKRLIKEIIDAPDGTNWEPKIIYKFGKNDTVEFQCGYSRKYPRLKFKIKGIDCSGTPLLLEENKNIRKTIKTEYCFKIYFTDFWQPIIGSNLLPRITMLVR